MKTDILTLLGDTPVAGAFVYGSVARGTATSASDIDVFVLLERPLNPTTTASLRKAFADLQLRLGYQPDLEYPVELFTIEAARHALVVHAPDEDQREVRRALTDTKIVIVASTRLDELILQAGGRP
jgi:predicted nucleotidyltransferase